MSKVSSYKKISWATIVNINENSTLEDFKGWSKTQHYIESPTKYAVLRLLLSFAVKVLYNENLGKFVKLLCRKGYIKDGDIVEAINIMLLYAMDKMPEDL